MNTHKTDRRKFLRRGFAGVQAAAAAGAIAVPAAAKKSAGTGVKKVIYKADEKPSKDAIFSSGIQYSARLSLPIAAGSATWNDPRSTSWRRKMSTGFFVVDGSWFTTPRTTRFGSS